MGIYTDLSGTNPIAAAKPRVGLDRQSAEQLLSKAALHDPNVKAALAASDEVTVIPEQTDAGVADTYTLTLAFHGRLAGNADVTTAAIAYDAVDTVIESAIDTAMASFPSWTNADVSVSMAGAAGLDDGTVTLTFDGASVTGAPIVVTLTATGFTATTPITRTAGKGDRKAIQALFDLNVVAGTVHDSPDTPADWTRPASNGQSRPRYQLIRDLALMASIEDGNDNVYETVVALYPVV